MSMGAILKAARDAIRTQTSKDFKFVGVMPEGRPPATMGAWFIGIDENRVESDERTAIVERFAIDVVLTVRTGVIPKDRADEIYLNNLFGLEPLERAVLTALHGQQSVRTAANAILAANAVANYYAFTQPLYYSGRGKSAPRGADWTGEENDNATFMTRTLPFIGGLRVQPISNVQ